MVARLDNQQAFQNTLTRIIVLPVLLLVVLLLVFLAQMNDLRSAAQWVDHTDQVISQMREVEILLLDQQTGLRGYLLTGDQQFLQPYQQSAAIINGRLDALSALVSDNPPQVQAITTIRAANVQWLANAQRLINVRAQGGDYQSLLRQRVGSTLMTQIRTDTAAFTQAEESLRDTRTRAVQQTTRNVIISSLCAMLVVGALLIFLLRRQVIALGATYETALQTVQTQAQALYNEREWFSGTLSSIGDAVIATDTNGTVTFMNLVAQGLTGYTEQAAQGKPLAEVFNIRNESTHTLVESPVDKVLRDGKIVGLANHTELVRPDEVAVPIDDSAAPIRDARGALLGVVLVFRDISERKQIENDLHERTTILRGVSDGAADAIIVKDRQGKILLANPATLRAIGKSEAEVIGKLTSDYLGNPADAARVIAHDQQVMTTGKTEIIEETVALPGGTRIFLSRKSPFLDDNGCVVGVIGISTDITERKRAEDALRESENQLWLALDAAEMGTWTWQRDDNQTVIGPRAGKLLGVDSGIRPEGLDIILPEDREVFQQATQQAVETNTLQVEFRILHPQRGTRWMELSGRLLRDEQEQPAKMIGVLRDITTRKHADTQLRASEQRYRDLADSMPLVVWTAQPDGEVDYFNNRWYEYTGQKLADSHGWGWQPVVHPDDVPACLEQWNYSVRTGEPYEIEYRWKRASDATYRWYLGRAQSTRDAQGRIVSWTGTGTDIDDQKRLETQLREQTDDLARATAQLEERNRELDHFAYVTSHDLKAPLRGIANLSQWIEEDLGDQVTDDIRRQLELLRGRVHRMEGLIEGILQYSRVGRVKSSAERVDVDVLLHDIVDLLAPAPSVQVEIGPNMPTLSAEKVQLQQVFQNLINNALKHHDRPQEAHIWVNVADAGSMYEFSVCDDGAGIAAQYHEKIFVIFQTLASRDKVEGSGLGLSLVKRIVENQNGRITVRSEEGRGAVFTFTWPKQPGKGH